MDDLILPEFRRERFAAGILAGTRGMQAMAAGTALPKRAAPWWFLPAAIAGLVLGVAAAVSLFKSGQKGWAWALLAALLGIVFLLLRAAWSRRRERSWVSGGGSGGGSGAVFGGGSSGGGGASGRW